MKKVVKRDLKSLIFRNSECRAPTIISFRRRNFGVPRAGEPKVKAKRLRSAPRGLKITGFSARGLSRLAALGASKRLRPRKYLTQGKVTKPPQKGCNLISPKKKRHDIISRRTHAMKEPEEETPVLDPDLLRIEIDYGQEYHCNSCRRDVTRRLRLHCAECNNYDACVSCFFKGKENGSHRKTHAYSVLKGLDFPIFESTWTANEELRLIDGIEIFGLGNWEQVAEHVGTKSSYECSTHWKNVYLESEYWPLPDMNKMIETSPIPESQTQKNSWKKVSTRPPPASYPESPDIQGYMPARGEFSVELYNDSEHVIKDLEFTDQDTPLEFELKMAMLSMYNMILDKRGEKKKLLFDYDLIKPKKRSKSERNLCKALGVFARMQMPADFNNFIQGTLNEMLLKERIAKLQELCRMGFRTKLEIEAYNEAHKKDNFGKKSPFYNKSPSHLRRNHTFQNTLKFSENHNSDLPNYPLEQQSQTPRNNGSLDTGKDAHNNLNNPGDDSELARSSPTQKYDISEMDGVNLLTSKECNLCTDLGIVPKSYLLIKEKMLREYALSRGLKLRRVKRLLDIDPEKTDRIYNFFVEMGWV